MCRLSHQNPPSPSQGWGTQDKPDVMAPPYIAKARLEGGNAKPTLLTVERYAKATGCRAVVKLVWNQDAA